MDNLGTKWKANGMRWKLNAPSDKPNITLYDQQLDAKLIETDLLLNACIKYLFIYIYFFTLSLFVL